MTSPNVVGQINLRKAEFKWEIENIRNILNHTERHLSPEFSADGMYWQLEMYPKGCNKTVSDYVSIFLWLVRSESEHITNCSFSIIDNQKSQCNQRICGIRKYSVSSIPTWGIPKFIHRQELIDKENRYLLEDKFVILLELYPSSYNIYNLLLIDFESMLNNKQFCDVEFTVKSEENDQHVYAHKCILSKKSEVFAAMFEHNMKENIENTVLIKDIDHQVIVEMLRFVYTGEVKNIETIAEELLIAADKYAIIDLKDVCSDYFYHNLSHENAIRYLNLASLYNADTLKGNAKEYIILNVKSMVGTSEFRSITDLQTDELYDIICCLVSKLT